MKNRKFSKNTTLLGILLLLCDIITSQSTVHLSIKEDGRGILKSRGKECFIIMPFHLIKDSEVRSVNITGENRKKSVGKYEKSFPGDIAIVRVEDNSNINCNSWSIAKNYTSMLSTIFEGYLEIRNDDGSLDNELVVLKNKSDEGISIQPKDTNFEFSKGMSGSSLFSNINGVKTYLGMLLSVDEENSRIGNVFQADDMDRIMSEFFQNDKINIPKGPETIESLKSLEEDGFKFDLIKIKKTGNKVVANINITSINIDGLLEIKERATKYYDVNGGFADAVNLRLSGKDSYNNSVGDKFTFPKGVSIPLEIHFENVPEANGIALLELAVYKKGVKIIKFRDITFDGQNTNSVGRNPSFEVLQTLEEDGFKFDLIKIKKTGNKVVANINITSINIDGLLEIKERATKYYDVNGGFADAVNLRLSGKDSYNNSVGDKFTFPKGVSIPLEIHFENVPEANGIALLELAVYKKDVKIIKFRDIKFE